jgi:hypothetical protein
MSKFIKELDLLATFLLDLMEVLQKRKESGLSDFENEEI